MPKWLFWLTLFFVVFLIQTQPANAGAVAGSFGEFSIDLLDSFGEFLSGLFEGASGEGSASNGLDNGAGTGDTGASADPTFSHDHGDGTHTHSG